MMLVGFSKVYFKLFLVLCFLDASYCCCKDGCCKAKTNASKKTHDNSMGKGKSNKSTGSGNPGDHTKGHTPTGHDNTNYDDKELSDIVCPGDCINRKVVSKEELMSIKSIILFGLSIVVLTDGNKDEEWAKIEKLFDEGKLVLYVFQTPSGPQYRLFGYIEDIKNTCTSSLFLSGELGERKGVKKLTNRIVAITVYDPAGLKSCPRLIDDVSLTTNTVFPDK